MSLFTVTGAGQVIVGFSLSITVTCCVQVAVFPWMSVTVQVTVVVPKVNTDGPLFVTLRTPQLSPVTGAPSETPLAVHFPGSLFTVTAGAHVIVGFSVSITVTCCVQVAVFPWMSVTVHVTVVVPTGKTEGALLVTEATPELSDVVGVPN